MCVEKISKHCQKASKCEQSSGGAPVFKKLKHPKPRIYARHQQHEKRPWSAIFAKTPSRNEKHCRFPPKKGLDHGSKFHHHLHYKKPLTVIEFRKKLRKISDSPIIAKNLLTLIAHVRTHHATIGGWASHKDNPEQPRTV